MNFSDSRSSPVKILVVDGYPHAAALLARSLSRLDARLEVVSATNARQALECAENGAIDILITDMNMPEMTGLELIEKLRQHPNGGPGYTFLLTATYAPELRNTAGLLDIDAVLSKPIPPQQMCQIVCMALEEMDLSRSYKEYISKKRFKILVADDESANLALLSQYLDGEGYAYSTACHGLDALEKMGNEYPDLILLDANMPYMDGYVVLQEIRKDPRTQQIPVIVLRAEGTGEPETHRDLNLPEDDFITRPIHRRELLLRIRKKLLEREFEKTSIARKPFNKIELNS